MAGLILMIVALIAVELELWDALVSVVGAVAAFLLLILLVLALLGLGGYYVIERARHRI